MGIGLLPRVMGSIFAVVVMGLHADAVCSQAYPNKPIRVLANPAGGAPDFVARLISPGLAVSLGQPVIVDNRGAAVAIETVAKAPPDGYTLAITASSLWLLPFLRDYVPWDPLKDFSPITLAITSPTILVVHPASLVKSVKELIALAKTRPGEFNYASTATGTTNHLGAELFKTMAGVNIARIPYKGAGPALNALIGGEVHLAFATTTSVTPHVKTGRLRALAITSAEPCALVPGLPTVAATVPGYESVSMIGIFAPAKIPALITKRLNQDIVRVLNLADVKERFFNSGAETVGGSPEVLAARMRSEMIRLGKLIKDAGIREE